MIQLNSWSGKKKPIEDTLLQLEKLKGGLWMKYWHQD